MVIDLKNTVTKINLSTATDKIFCGKVKHLGIIKQVVDPDMLKSKRKM
jgi:hypothetical protein